VVVTVYGVPVHLAGVTDQLEAGIKKAACCILDLRMLPGDVIVFISASITPEAGLGSGSVVAFVDDFFVPPEMGKEVKTTVGNEIAGTIRSFCETFKAVPKNGYRVIFRPFDWKVVVEYGVKEE